MKNDVDVVLVAPVFFRAAGSRNNKASISLMYMSAQLEKAGISHVVYNADHVPSPPGGNVYLRWRKLFENFDAWFKPVVDGNSSLYGEMYEQILSWRPKMVVIQSSDVLLPTVDWGNAWIAANLARMLRKRGDIFVVGCGLFNVVDRRFDREFDAMIVGEPGPAVAQLFNSRQTGLAKDKFDPIVPSLKHLWPAGQNTEQVMASHGCSWGCEFCLAPKVSPVQIDIPIDVIVQDVLQRPEEKLYFGDMIYPIRGKRVKAIADAFVANGIKRRWTVESRVDVLTEEKLDDMVRTGVERVKIGIESVDPEALRLMDKKSSPARIEEAVKMLRDRGIKTVAYLMLGGHLPDSSYDATLEYCNRVAFDHYVVNVWSYDDPQNRDYRYDTHFSMECARRWGVKWPTLEKFLELQRGANPTVGVLVD